MGIIESASKLAEMAHLLAIEKGITDIEAWDEAVEEYSKLYEERRKE
ncbi:hypothetical protein KGF42_02380 [Clostridioides sp. ZZV15-6383]|nr:hypothetical protein [Clostridioides sp. ZZV14-6345]MCC0698304.1 hypothetical protein [Clostridioides sp. ZZV15-6383]